MAFQDLLESSTCLRYHCMIIPRFKIPIIDYATRPIIQIDVVT